ncbi:MogA/MoaB family molybdenum cofactor biosynthesis protein [Mycoplasmatota bacterium WC44]
MFRVGIIVASDKGASGDRIDISGEVIRDIMKKSGYTVIEKLILPDDLETLSGQMKIWCDENTVDLILTTGGTGFSSRDVTPEATKRIIDKEVPGFAEVMRAESLKITPKAMLSRSSAGIRNFTLIINMPGSPKAVEESLGFILPALDHGLKILVGEATECARS